MGSGGTILEKLVERNDWGMTLNYIILDGVLPVKNYRSTLKVETKDGGAVYEARANARLLESFNALTEQLGAAMS